MNWTQVAKREWQAKTDNGTFCVTLRGRLFWSRFNSGRYSLKFQPKRTLAEAKAHCEQSLNSEFMRLI